MGYALALKKMKLLNTQNTLSLHYTELQTSLRKRKTKNTHPSTVRTSAQALCYSTTEFSTPIWARIYHTKNIDIALNEICSIISGCFKSTPVKKIQAYQKHIIILYAIYHYIRNK
ncbi:lachesin-like [Aphis craccivora]|uniref:Lachesin-like n=1 Tax=Aphis craccivora TaxID=307492 RepID=A0A6G0Z9Z8_APHCR|nr:lachesin-like [Aphis craccivora]